MTAKLESRLYPGGKAHPVRVLTEATLASLSIEELGELHRALTTPIAKSERNAASLAEKRWYAK
jgi:hypothetical protein